MQSPCVGMLSRKLDGLDLQTEYVWPHLPAASYSAFLQGVLTPVTSPRESDETRRILPFSPKTEILLRLCSASIVAGSVRGQDDQAIELASGYPIDGAKWHQERRPGRLRYRGSPHSIEWLRRRKLQETWQRGTRTEQHWASICSSCLSFSFVCPSR